MKTFPIVQHTRLCSLLLAIYLLAPQAAWAQCPNDNTPISTVPANLSCGTGLETLATGVSGGQYLPVNVINGNTYTFETCDASDPGFDTEMTIYRESNGALIDNNDDDCNTDSRVTFTANFTGVVRVLIDESGCGSNSLETGILASCTAPPCTITVDFFGNPSACNDNGTPNDPSDDFFTQNIHASFFNRPSTGSLQIVPGGDQIGTYSIPVNQISGNSHLFSAVQLKADGTPSVVQMNFTDNPVCIDADTGPTVQPCSTPPPPCEIIGFSFANIGPCNDNGTPNNDTDDFFEVDVDVLFSNTNQSAVLDLNGSDIVSGVSGVTPVPIGVNLTHTFNAVKMRADGIIPEFQSSITVFIGPIPVILCSLPGTGPSVNSCSNGGPPPCEIIGFSFANIGPCNDNGTPSNDADDFFEVDVDVLYSNSTPNADLAIVGPDVAGGTTVGPALVGTNLTHTFVNVRLRADGQITDFTGQIIAPSAGPILCSGPGTGPAVGECSSGSAPCSVTSIDLENQGPCDDNGTPNDPGDDFYTLDITINYLNRPSTGNLELELGNGTIGIHEVPVAGLPVSGSHTFIGVPCKANGNIPVVEAKFTGLGNQCSGTIGAPVVEPCVCPQVTFLPGGANTFVECDGSGNAAAFNTWLAGGALTVAPSSGTIVSITHGQVIETALCGNTKKFASIFTVTNDCGNSADVGIQFIIEDHTPPTLVCPAPAQVSCFEQIPPANTSLVTGVSDACGSNPIVLAHVSDASGPDGVCDNDFTITRTYRATDACSNAATCTQTIIIRDLIPPTITCAAQTTPIECPATPVFTPPTATDNCTGNVAITFNDVTVPGLCPGTFTRTRTWTATDPCQNTATCARSITVRDVTPPPVPANTASTVACPALAIAPVPPVVIDACAGAINPTGPVVTNSPNPLTCEGTRTFSFTFTDCSGNASQWSHVTTIEREPFTINVPFGNATVACPDQTDVLPTTPVVTSSCGEILTPMLLSVSAKPGCEGDRAYTFRYTDCEGNTADWLFIYHVEYQAFAIPPSEVVNVECPLNASQPVPPVVHDNCGKLLQPIGPVIASTQDSQGPNWAGCETSRQYTWTYADCEGNTQVWSKTFFFQRSSDFSPFPDETSVVACLAFAVQPFPPTFFDACGQQIKVVLTGISEEINPGGCSGWRKFDFTYTDCGGHSHPWSFTYFINDDQAPLGSCPSGNTAGGPVSVNVDNLACIEEVPCPTDYDFSEKIEEMLLEGNYFDACSGDDLVVTLDSYSELWQCADPDPTEASSDGQFTFGRTFYFNIADPCGNAYPSLCEVSFSGKCLPIVTFRQEEWGVAGDAPGNAVSAASSDLSVIGDLLFNNPLKIGGNHRSLTITDPQCVVDLLPGLGIPGVLANCQQTNCTGCNPMAVGGMKNSLAANLIALSLNLRYNVHFKGLNINGLRNQGLGCIQVSDNILSCPSTGSCHLRMYDADGSMYLFPNSIGGLLDMANLFLDGGLNLTATQKSIYASAMKLTLSNVNAYWSTGQATTTCSPDAGASPADSSAAKDLPQANAMAGKPISIQIAPNPATRYITLKLGELDEEREVRIEIFNAFGQKQLGHDFGKVASLSERVELHGMQSGMYIAVVHVGYRLFAQKLFISKEGGALLRQ